MKGPQSYYVDSFFSILQQRRENYLYQTKQGGGDEVVKQNWRVDINAQGNALKQFGHHMSGPIGYIYRYKTG